MYELFLLMKEALNLHIWGKKSFKNKALQRFFEYRKFKEGRKEKILEMNAHLFFSSKEMWRRGNIPAKIAKLHFIKDLLAMTEGDC